MRIEVIGGGPAGLFMSLLVKQARPSWDLRVHERAAPGDTFGFGVVFSNRTLEVLHPQDPSLWREIEGHLTRWDAIDTWAKGERVRVEGHRFAGCSRGQLLETLHERCRRAGVDIQLGSHIDDLAELNDADLIVAADGVSSRTRTGLSDSFGARTHWGSSRFIWLASDLPLSSFSFFFREDQAGLWQVHAYPYTEGRSTFIVETDEATWRAAGLGDADEAASLDYLSALFAPELSGYRLYTNRSFWRQFPTIECARWSSGKVTLLGDAAHTAHFSIGSGTRLAMQGANALAKALLQSGDVEAAQRRYEADHRPEVERLQGAAENSRLWFEEAAFYHGQLSARELTTSMMNRTQGGRGSRARPPLYSAG